MGRGGVASRRVMFLLSMTAALVVILALGAGVGSASTTPDDPGVLCGPGCGSGGPGYTNPFQSSTGLLLGRTDQGVDYAGYRAIDAIGDGVVKAVHQDSGWYGYFLVYELTDNTYAGDYVYLAEGIDPVVSAGQTITEGQEIATFSSTGHDWNGSDTGIETGWASSSSASNDWTLFRTLCGSYNNSGPTAIGDAFARFLRSVGASTEQNPGSGPDYTTSCAYTSS